MRKIGLLFVSFCLLSVLAFAQSDKDRSDLKRKIEMAIRRIDMRLDKVNKDMEKMNEKAKESSSEYKGKLEAAKAELNDDLKRLPEVKSEEWKDFNDEVAEHMDSAKESTKPVML